MRILSVNHLRLGSSASGVPRHLIPDQGALSTRVAWQRAVSLAIREGAHAVFLTGQTISTQNPGLEPWGPFCDGLAELEQAGIPVVAVADGDFNARNLQRFSRNNGVHWLNEALDWQPVLTTEMQQMDAPSVHIIDGTLSESDDTPADNPVTMDRTDHPDSIWILTSPLQPDQFRGEHALIIEPGSASPLSAHETGRHGAWLIDTESRSAQLVPLANLEFASESIDIGECADLETFERIVASRLVESAIDARKDGSIATVMLLDATLTGATDLFPVLAETATELQRTMVIEHDGMSIALSGVTVDATPPIDLDPLLNRPDPVGEVARLIRALETDEELSETQSLLLTATEQKLLAITHARVFGSIHDLATEVDASTLLRRQSWATLDALVRQRGID